MIWCTWAQPIIYDYHLLGEGRFKERVSKVRDVPKKEGKRGLSNWEPSLSS